MRGGGDTFSLAKACGRSVVREFCSLDTHEDNKLVLVEREKMPAFCWMIKNILRISQRNVPKNDDQKKAGTCHLSEYIP